MLQVVRWHESPFRVEFDAAKVAACESQDAAEHLRIRCEDQAGRTFVYAEINKKPFVLGECEFEQPKRFTFSVLSMSGFEVTGKVTYKPSIQ
jgi:hypothetical protein